MAGLLLMHGSLLAWTASRTSPMLDEVAHLPAGLYVWQFGRFDLYRVNPPLVRSIAALPAALFGPQSDWRGYRTGLGVRPEWDLGAGFVRANGWENACRFFIFGRWACVPLVLSGGWFCFRWARELYGCSSGILALALYCTCPNILAWGSTICPDAAGAAMGVAGGYFFWRWLMEARRWRAICAGVTLGILELTKTTWIILFALWPLLWLVWTLRRCANTQRSSSWRQPAEMAMILFIALIVINVGYGFERSFRRLRDYTFVSRSLAGCKSRPEGGVGGNRFADCWIGAIPVPVPESYLSGIDVQKLDFEEGKDSYLFGEWKRGGWWYYYLVCAALKVPLGTLVLGLLSVGAVLTCATGRTQKDSSGREKQAADGHGYSAGWRNELTLILPALVVFGLVSSQTGFSRYFRYVLPCFPFVYIWMSKLARSLPLGHHALALVALAALAWSVASSLWIYPHSVSYFNELAGGPLGGHRCLVDANIDWGQDLSRLKDWADEHPEAEPLHVAYHYSVSAELMRIQVHCPPKYPEPDRQRSRSEAVEIGPSPGWYAMSIHGIHSSTERNGYFLWFHPVATAGYSIYIYHITLEEANRRRREMALPELTAESGWQRGPDVADPRSKWQIE
ncbi:MAG: ArnT family glycosyltransferase [Thermoguttaceae bacterium]